MLSVFCLCVLPFTNCFNLCGSLRLSSNHCTTVLSRTPLAGMKSLNHLQRNVPGYKSGDNSGQSKNWMCCLEITVLQILLYGNQHYHYEKSTSLLRASYWFWCFLPQVGGCNFSYLPSSIIKSTIHLYEMGPLTIKVPIIHWSSE